MLMTNAEVMWIIAAGGFRNSQINQSTCLYVKYNNLDAADFNVTNFSAFPEFCIFPVIKKKKKKTLSGQQHCICSGIL